jgi:hypothetical protein
MFENLRALISLISRSSAERGAAGFVIMAAVFGYIAIGEARSASAEAAAQQWPTVEGTISSASMVKGCNKGTGYAPYVEYGYVVTGRYYGPDSVRFGPYACGAEEIVKAEMHDFVVGANLRVHVDPADTSQSLAVGVFGQRQDLSSSALGLWLIAGVFGVGAAACFCRLRLRI